jgi:hypothetical protein
MPSLADLLARPDPYLGQSVSIDGDVTLHLVPEALKTIAPVSSTLIHHSLTIAPNPDHPAEGLHILLEDPLPTTPAPQFNDPYIVRQLDAVFATLPDLHAFFRATDADSASHSKTQFHIHLGHLSISGTLAHFANDPATLTLIDIENATFTQSHRSVHCGRSGIYTPAALLPDINFLEPIGVRRNLDMYLGHRIAVQGKIKRLTEFAITAHEAKIDFVVPKSVGTAFGDDRETAYFQLLRQSIHLHAPTLEAEIAAYIPSRRGPIPYDEDCWIIGTLDTAALDHYVATLHDIELAIIANGGRMYQWDFSTT